MDIKVLLKKFRVLLYVCKLRYPKYYSLVFPLYMFLRYNQILASKIAYQLRPVPDKLLIKFLIQTRACLNDPLNTILINNRWLCIHGMQSFARMQFKFGFERVVQVLSFKNVSPNSIVMSDTLYYNLKKEGSDENPRLSPFKHDKIKVATSVNLSLINLPYDVSNSTVDIVLKNYFSTPKIVHKDDILSVDIKVFSLDEFLTNTKANKVEMLYFKCNKIESDSNTNCIGPHFCVFNKTTLTQTANIQSYIIPRSLRVLHNDNLICECPEGLINYFKRLEAAFKPFLNIKSTLNLKPAFLLEGSKGSGKMVIIKAFAYKYGLHLFSLSNCDISGNAYAQTEIRMKNAFFKAKLSSPCVLVVKNFENFGKNNEGQYDQRIINFFNRELENLFTNNNFPVICVCLSNTKEISVDLKRTFLEIFDINAPNQNERAELLKWLLESCNLNFNFDLETVASKTNGFLYGDLKALVYYCRNISILNSGEFKEIIINESDFSKALEIMHANYKESLGAPKVPQVQWSDVGGLDDVKSEIKKLINFPLQHPELVQKSGLRRSGILLYGPPGTGKTLIAKAVATECNLCFLSVKGPELLNSYVGQSEQNVREVFEKARQAAPCIIFFDELDSLAPNRGVAGDSGGVMDRIVSQLLSEMDGVNKSTTVFVIGATNRPDLIDPALLRPGRFDKLLYVGPCTDLESKLSVLKALTRKFNMSSDVKLENVVKTCPKNITGADFYGISSASWMLAARKLVKGIENGEINLDDVDQNSVIVNMEDFKSAVRNVKPSVSVEDLLYFEKLKSELS